jgi:hypothetical protein
MPPLAEVSMQTRVQQCPTSFGVQRITSIGKSMNFRGALLDAKLDSIDLHLS